MFSFHPIRFSDRTQIPDSVESPTQELSVVRLPLDKHYRSIHPGGPVLELLALWGEREDGPGESQGDRRRLSRYHTVRLAIYLA